MKCQKCNKREANTHYTQIINGKKTELYLCDQCASESEELSSFKLGFDSDFDNFFSGFFGNSFANALNSGVTTQTEKACKECGMTLREFLNGGKFGCSECYEAFAPFLSRPLKQIHGATEHTGKFPKRCGFKIGKDKKISKLELELNQAVMAQNFEKAAELRDKIKELRGE